jgi:hypothetical protein
LVSAIATFGGSVFGGSAAFGGSGFGGSTFTGSGAFAVVDGAVAGGVGIPGAVAGAGSCPLFNANASFRSFNVFSSSLIRPCASRSALSRETRSSAVEPLPGDTTSWSFPGCAAGMRSWTGGLILPPAARPAAPSDGGAAAATLS